VKQPDISVAETGSRATGWRLKWRRFAWWFNPTLIQNALWPVVAILAGFQLHSDADSNWEHWLGGVIATTLAIGLGYVILRRNHISLDVPAAAGTLAANARLVLLGLPLMLLIGRLATQDIGATIRLSVAGLLSAIAYQLINMRIGAFVFDRRWVVVALFAASWLIHEVAWFIARDSTGSLPWVMVGGLTAGALVGLGSLGLDRWPGGSWTTASAQFLVVTLIFGFTS
jgi:hypothetical protein